MHRSVRADDAKIDYALSDAVIQWNPVWRIMKQGDSSHHLEQPALDFSRV